MLPAAIASSGIHSGCTRSIDLLPILVVRMSPSPVSSPAGTSTPSDGDQADDPVRGDDA